MDTSQRPFRFGVTMLAAGRGHDWAARCRAVEDLGFDVISLPDHLGMPSPLMAAVAAAGATSRVRVSTSVINTGFHNPVLLARDIATADQLTDGRLEVGLGTGYVRAENETAGLPWPSAGARVDHLEQTVARVRGLLAGDHVPAAVQCPCPPVLLGVRGDRMAMLAARTADIIGFTGVAPGPADAPPVFDDAEAVAERIGFARALLGERAGSVELNFLLAKVIQTKDRTSLAAQGALDQPALLVGTPAQMAEELRARRRELGLSYFTVLEPDMAALAEVIPLL